jgi:dienelactone hydrolase
MGSSTSTPQQPDCCPPGSLPEKSAALAGATGPLQGSCVMLSDKVEAYVVKPNEPEKIMGTIVMCHDVFGYKSGRTFYLADIMSAWGYLVIVPDFYTTDLPGVTDVDDLFSVWAPWRLFSGSVGTFYRRLRKPWEEMHATFENLVLPYVEKNGGKGLKIGLFGFCYGGWMMTRLSTQSYIACGASAHPSPMVQQMQASGPTLQEMYDAVKAPLLYMPAGNDPKSIFPDGAGFQSILKASPKSKCVPFKDMTHGWFNRGDIRNEKVKAAVDQTLAETKAFFAEHLASRL